MRTCVQRATLRGAGPGSPAGLLLGLPLGLLLTLRCGLEHASSADRGLARCRPTGRCDCFVDHVSVMNGIDCAA